jgi:hypothetical protein
MTHLMVELAALSSAARVVSLCTSRQLALAIRHVFQAPLVELKPDRHFEHARSLTPLRRLLASLHATLGLLIVGAAPHAKAVSIFTHRLRIGGASAAKRDQDQCHNKTFRHASPPAQELPW